jgi:hypothetical protein
MREKFYLKHQGTKRAGVTTRAHSAPHSTPFAPRCIRRFRIHCTLRDLVPNFNSAIGVEVGLVGTEVGRGDAATNPAVI